MTDFARLILSPRSSEQMFGFRFKSATISVPVGFTHEQRAATVRAGEAAGFRMVSPRTASSCIVPHYEAIAKLMQLVGLLRYYLLFNKVISNPHLRQV
jgi:hypothetical protein